MPSTTATEFNLDEFYGRVFAVYTKPKIPKALQKKQMIRRTEKTTHPDFKAAHNYLTAQNLHKFDFGR